MRTRWKKPLWIVLMICLVLPVTSNAEVIVGGMTVRQAFPDERVAKLVEATVHGDYAEADKQLKAGADVNCTGTDGLSPLLWVIYEGRRTRDYHSTEYLLKAGANPNYRDAKQKRSAMYFAAGGDSPELLDLLLKYVDRCCMLR
jgi:ankyrin repeat protein